MIAAAPTDRVDRFFLHGVRVELTVSVPSVSGDVDGVLGPFRSDIHSENSNLRSVGPVISGVVRPYDQAEVLRHVSPAARRVPGIPAIDVFRDGERFWVVDDRWGLAEMNLLKGTWRSWMLPSGRTLRVDGRESAAMAVLWPLAQVLRGRGLSLLPAAAVARDRCAGGILLLAMGRIDRELAALEGVGYRIVGRRWTCLREAGAAGHVMVMPFEDEGQPVVCAAAVVIAPGRHSTEEVSELRGSAAVDALRRGWPIAELHRSRGRLPSRLSSNCKCYEVRLSREAEDFVAVLDRLNRELELPKPRPQAVVARAVSWAAGGRRFLRSHVSA